MSRRDVPESQANRRDDLAALFITLVGFLARLWVAHGIFLNPDEALHFRLANQRSLALAYQASLTASHPPLLTFVLYFWRLLGTSELWLRMPSVLAGVAFCWMFYKWLAKAGGNFAALIGLLFVAFLPPIVELAAEIRQYSLLLAFLAAALLFLDEAFAKKSPGRMAVSILCLYFAMLSHYSAFLFAAALGIYALYRIFTERPPLRATAVWAIGQIGGLALALFLYKTHLSKLGSGDSLMPLNGWMSDHFLRHSYFDPSHDNPVLFLLGHSFGVFQYFFEQLAVGDVMGLLFVVGAVLLLRGKGSRQGPAPARRLGLFLILPFAIAMAVSLAHLYPYGGTRHMSFLIIPAVAGVSVAIAVLIRGNRSRGIAITIMILAACIAFGKSHQQRMNRANQNRAHMAEALQFVETKIPPSEIIFTDYQGDLLLGHYLCRQRAIVMQPAPANFGEFSCESHRIVTTDYKEWIFDADHFPQTWNRFVQDYGLKSGDSIWVFQAGWAVDLPEQLRERYAEFRDLRFETFGNNIKIFRMTVGQSMAVENTDTSTHSAP